MSVGSICQRDVVSIRPDEDLVDAARLMRERHVGYLVVVEPAAQGSGDRVVGVVTDRDIVVTVVAREVDPHSLAVGDVMTRELLVAEESASIEATLRHMRELGVRRVPVVNDRGNLTGVMSVDDALDAVADQLNSIAGSIRNELRIERYVRP